MSTALGLAPGRLHQGPAAAVLFDFNGTLSDDERMLGELFVELSASELGVEITMEHYVEHLLGLSDAEIVEKVSGLTGQGVDGDWDRVLDELGRRYVAAAGTGELVRSPTRAFVAALAARGVPQGIVTGAQRREVSTVLEASGIGAHMDVVVTMEDVTDGKPHPEGYLSARDTLGFGPDDLLVVFEDSVVGLHAAREAGMATIAVEGSAPLDVLLELADLVVPRIEPALLELPAFGG